jgi:hypothetical protein
MEGAIVEGTVEDELMVRKALNKVGFMKETLADIKKRRLKRAGGLEVTRLIKRDIRGLDCTNGILSGETMNG